MRGTFADKEKKKEKKKAKTMEQTALTANKKPGLVRWTKVLYFLVLNFDSDVFEVHACTCVCF